jgi:tetrathionate reductase subunit B
MKRHLCLVIDLERCIGCEACTVACRLENDSTQNWIRVETQNTAHDDTHQDLFPNLRMSFLPRLCNHCAIPLCVDVCTLGALYKRKDGPVVLDQGKCVGCKACIEICPYDAILFNTDTQKAEKCNLCIHRTDKGLEPFCVKCCEGQAMHFGDLNDTSSIVSKLLATRDTFQLNPQTGTDPSIYYCKPKAPRGLYLMEEDDARG